MSQCGSGDGLFDDLDVDQILSSQPRHAVSTANLKRTRGGETETEINLEGP
jgi:hypothetical protein